MIQIEKRRIAAALAVLAVAVVAMGIVAEASDSQADDHVSIPAPLATEVPGLTAIEAAFDADGETIDTSMLPEDLKKYLTVTGTVNEVEVELTSAQYDVTTDSGFLTPGDCTVTISSGEISDTVTVANVQPVGISNLEFNTDDLGQVFVTTDNETVGEKVTVTAVFSNGVRQTLSPDMYTVNFNKDVGTQTFSISVNFNGENIPGSFTYEVSELEMTGLRVDVGGSSEFTTSMNSYRLHDALAVYGTFNDGNEYRLPAYGFDYEVEGSLLAGPTEIEGPYPATITVTPSDNDSEAQPVETTIQVTPVKLERISAEDQRMGSYQAYTTVDNGSEWFSVRAYFVDGNSTNLSTGDYSITYEGVGEGEPQSFRYGHGTITVHFTENGITKTDTISGYNVTRALVELPDLNTGTISYGDTADWLMTGFDDRLRITTSEGLSYSVDPNDDTRLHFTATEAGKYTVVVSPLNDSIVLVQRGTDDPLLEGEVNQYTYTLTISAAQYDIELTLDDDIIAGESGYLTIELTGPNGESVPLPSVISYRYSGTNMLGKPIEGTGLPTDAGTWNVYVTVPASGNFRETGKYTGDFIIDRVVHGAPTPVGIPYDGVAHSVEFGTGVDTSFFEVTGDEHTDVDEGYESTLIISDDCWNNHCWTGGERSVVVYWNIVQSPNDFTEKPSITGWDFDESPNSPSAKATFGDQSGIVFTFSQSRDDADSYRTMDEIEVWSAGTWYMKATSPTDGRNYTSVTSEPLEFQIGKMQVDYPAEDTSTFVYTGGTLSYNPLGFDESFMTMTVTQNGSTLEDVTNAGTYTVTVTLDGNHEWDTSSAHGDLNDEGDPTFTWTVGTAENTVESFDISGWTYGSGINTPSNVVMSFSDDYTVEYSRSRDDGFRPANEISSWDAGTWYVRVTSGSSDNYTSDQLTKNIVIAKLAVDYPSEDASDFEYTGGTLSYNPSGFDESFMTLTVTQNGSTLEDVTNAGTYTVTVTLDGNHEWDTSSAHGDLNDEGDPTFTWTVGKMGIDAGLNQRDFTFNGSPQTPTITGDSTQFSVKWENQESTVIDSYEVYLTLNDKTNYEWDHDGEQYGDSVSGDVLTLVYRIVGQTYDLTIQIGDGGSDVSWTYGNAHLQVSWNSDIPTEISEKLKDQDDYGSGWFYVFNGIDGTEYYGKDWPTDAGSYSVYLFISDTGIYANKTSNTVTFSIDPAKITEHDIEDHGWTYDAQSHSVLFDGEENIVPNATTVDGTTPTWSYSMSSDPYEWGTPFQITKSGTYTVWYRVSAENHETIIDSFTLTVGKAEITGIVIPGGDWTYDGEYHGAMWNGESDGVPSGSALGNDISWTYKTDVNGEFTGEIPTFRNAGTHTVYYRADADNHDPAYGSFEVHVGKRTIDLAFSTNTSVYSNSEPSVQGWDFELDGSDVCSGDSLDTLTNLVGISLEQGVTRWNVGYYDLVATISDTNYELRYDGSDKFEITKRPLSLEDATIVYGDEAPGLSAIIGNIANGDTIDDAVTGTADLDGYVPGSDYGRYKIAVGQLAAGANYSIDPSETATLTVSQRQITVEIQNDSSTYGDAIDALEGIVIDGNLALDHTETDVFKLYLTDEGDSGEIDISVTVNAGTYHIHGTVLNNNYAIRFLGKSDGGTEPAPEYGTYIVNPRSVTIEIVTENGSMDYTGDPDAVLEKVSSMFRVDNDPDSNFPEPDFVFMKDDDELGQIPTDAGKYTVRPVYSSNTNYVPSSDLKATFTINKIDYDLPTLGWDVMNDGNSVSVTEYNGGEYTAVLSSESTRFTDGSTVITGIDDSRLTVSYSIVHEGPTVGGAVDAGTYVVTATFHSDSGNYNIPEDMTYDLEVQPAQVTIVWEPTGDRFTYDGTDQKSEVTAHYVDVKGIDIPLTVTIEGTFEIPRTEAYVFTAGFSDSDTGKGNYALPDNPTRSYYMDRMPVTISVSDQKVQYGDLLDASGWSYEFTDGTILEKDLEEGGYVQLYVDRNVTGDNPLPADQAYADAIKYTIQLRNEYYDITPEYGDLKVTKRSIVITIPTIERTYDGQPADLGTLTDI